MPLLLPPWVAENALKEQMVDDQMALARGFNKLLRDYDPHLDLVFARENANDPALVPGCWHIRRRAPGTSDRYFPITTREGHYREPSATDIDRLSERDLWRTGRLQSHLDRHRRVEEKAQRSHNLWREQARDEVAADFRTGMRIPGEGGFHGRKWGKK